MAEEHTEKSRPCESRERKAITIPLPIPWIPLPTRKAAKEELRPNSMDPIGGAPHADVKERVSMMETICIRCL